MISWFRKKPTPEERSLDTFLDNLVSPSSENRQPPSSQIEHFAGWFQGLPGEPYLPPVDRDQVLKALLAKQERMVHDHNPTALPPRHRDHKRENERASRDDDEYGEAALVSNERSPGRLWTQVPSYAMAAVILGLVALGMFTFIRTYDRDDDSGLRPGHIGLLDKSADDGDGGSDFASPTADPLPSVTIDGVTINIRDWDLLGIIRTAFADEKPARDLFLVLDVTLVNTREATNRDAPFKNLWVVDENDEAYAIDKYGTVLANDAVVRFGSVSNIVLPTGEDHDLILVFDVPSDITTLYLTDADRTFSIPIVGP